LSGAGLLDRVVGWFDVAEVGAGAWPEVGVGDLVVADPVDVAETEVVGVLIEDAAGRGLDVMQAAARSVHAEDADDLAGVHAVTVSRPGDPAVEANVLTRGAETRAPAEAVHTPRSRTRARHLGGRS
jgi:hypothetical protein